MDLQLYTMDADGDWEEKKGPMSRELAPGMPGNETDAFGITAPLV